MVARSCSILYPLEEKRHQVSCGLVKFLAQNLVLRIGEYTPYPIHPTKFLKASPVFVWNYSTVLLSLPPAPPPSPAVVSEGVW